MTPNFTIKTVWAWRSGEDGPELLDAWEEYAVDANQEGWREALRKHAAFVADPANGFYIEQGIRVVDLLLDLDRIKREFYPPEVEAEVARE